MELSLSEIVQLSTVRLRCEMPGGHLSLGTGFFFQFSVASGNVLFIVTNNHVVEGARSISFRVSLLDSNDIPLPNQYEDFHIENVYQNTIPHPEADTDLCLVNVGIIDQQIKGRNVNLAMAPMAESTIPQKELEMFKPIEDIYMVGYPIGLSDEINNLPLVRKGITSTPFYISHNGKSEFLIDCACFPGSSGSPVVILNEGSFSFRDGKVLTGNRFFLTGILYSGPQFGANGQVEKYNIPMIQNVSINIPMNLGYCVQAKKLLEFKPLIDKIIALNSSSDPNATA